ncbi:MAG: patatin family protein [Candidatus Enteromonas sp.]|nr:patatin family protein [Candidatus Enteromonas sp.]
MESKVFENVALVAQGGGSRGAFTAGVEDVLLREGIRFPYLIGTSAGALNNLDFLSEDYGRSKVVTTELLGDRKFLSLHNLIRKGGLFDFSYLIQELPKERLPFDFETFEKSSVRFVCAATSLDTGEAAYFEKGVVRDFWKAVEASASLPAISKPVLVDGAYYLDGGQSAPIPFQKAREDGYSKMVVILTRPRDFRRRMKIGVAKELLYKALYRAHPEFLASYFGYSKVYNAAVDELLQMEKRGEVFLIAPEVGLGVSKTERNPQKLIRVYEAGVQIAEKNLHALKEFLEHE